MSDTREMLAARPGAPEGAARPAAASAMQSPQLDMGRVISRTFGAVGRNFPLFFGIAALFGASPALAVQVALQNFGLDALRAGTLDTTGFGLLTAGVGLVAALPGFIAAGAITHGAIVSFNGGRASLGACLATGFGRFFLLLLQSLVLILAGGVLLAPIVGGLTWLTLTQGSSPTGVFAFVPLLVLIPFTVVLTVICVAPAALVTERKGVFGSLGRSRALTHGDRFRIFWILVFAMIAGSLASGAVTLLANAVSGPRGPLELAANVSFQTATSLPALAINGAWSAIYSALVTTGAAAIYFELRANKEGASSDQLGRVFD